MGGSPATVSVIIPTKDRSALLAGALSSVRALHGPDLDLDVIVADNGSTDDTSAVAERFGARLVSAATKGAAAARNAGLRAASGEFLAFLDDDDVWLSGHLRPHIALLRRQADFAAAVGQVQIADGDLKPLVAPYPEAMPGDGDLFPAFLRDYPQIGATVARTSVRDSVGFFDETLIGDQDWDWHLRLALTHRVGFVPVPALLFRQRPPGHGDDLRWRRVSYTRRVFWSNIKRAGPRAPGALAARRLWLHHAGHAFAYFAQAAVHHAALGDRSAVRTSIRRGLRLSPAHFGREVVRSGEFRGAVVQALRP